MAKRNLVLLFILGFLAKSSLAAEPITAKNWPKFADIEWGSSKEAVKKALEEKGYECKTGTINGEELVSFSGILAGTKAGGLARFKSKKLERIQILYRKNKTDFDEIALSGKLGKILGKKYGRPINLSTEEEVVAVWANADDPTQIALSFKCILGGDMMVSYRSLASVKRFYKESEEGKKRDEDF